MSDLISRQDAIDTLGEEPLVWDENNDYDVATRNQWIYDVECIKEVPSANLRTCEYWDSESNYCALCRPSAEPEPSDVARDIARIIENEIDMRVIAQSERKKGEWIDTETSYADGVQQECRCSVCTRLSLRPLGDFCRWCGADMRGEQE